VATLGNLLTFPWIKSRVDAGKLELLAAYFDVATGSLAIYDPATRVFATIHSDILPSMLWPAAE
jgi:carbonic anhydrase